MSKDMIGRWTLLTLACFLFTRLVCCHDLQHYPDPEQKYHREDTSLGYVRSDDSELQTWESRDTKPNNSYERQDGAGISPMPMLQWMRQMIFKTKSMYIKHKLEFELTGCFMGFVRKIISLIYNSLYSFNKKLMFAKNIKIEDIRGLSDAASALPNNVTSTTESNVITSAVGNISADNDHKTRIYNSNDLGTKNNNTIEIVKKVEYLNEKQDVVFSSKDYKHKDHINVTHIEKSKEQNYVNKHVGSKLNNEQSFVNNTDVKHTLPRENQKNGDIQTGNNMFPKKQAELFELESRYEKLNRIKEQLEKNVNKMNTLYENISLHLNNFEAAMKNISGEELTLHNVGSKTIKNCSQSTTINKIQQITKEVDKIHSLNSNFFKINKLDRGELHSKVDSGKKSPHQILNNEIISYNYNDINSTEPFVSLDDKQSLIQNRNQYNFTQDQIKSISDRVSRVLKRLSRSTDSTGDLEFSSRQFSQDSILNSINSVILYFLGFTPEEESLAYFMSMVGEQTRENLLRIGSGFHSMRNSQLFACMSHYGSTKFWNWIDSCC